MASPLPAALKAADIQRFATRAAQLEKYKPIVTYWLEYYMLQRIIKEELHTKSGDAAEYAGQLMDKLEQTKTEYEAEPAVTDDVAAKAYMEQFALQTFNRAEADQNADKVTRQTADTFQAAATFFDSLNIWGDLDAENHAKSKFGKFHALRIAKALKEGKDPNETNPKVEPEPVIEIDEEDAELRAIEQELSGRSVTQSTTQGISDQGTTSADRLPSEVSPIDVDANIADRPVSIGGGYFPSVPTSTNEAGSQPLSSLTGPHIDEETHIPRQITAADMMTSNINNETHIPQQTPMAGSTGLYDEEETHSAPHVTSAEMNSAHIDEETHIPVTAKSADPAQFYAGAAKAPAAAAPLPAPSSTSYRTNDEAVLDAQKHAKWAISALDFEDIPTAVKELRIALQSLGGL